MYKREFSQKKLIVGKLLKKKYIFDKKNSQIFFAFNEKNCTKKLSCACCQVIAINNYDDFQHLNFIFLQ
jgi:hypothetical protein